MLVASPIDIMASITCHPHFMNIESEQRTESKTPETVAESEVAVLTPFDLSIRHPLQHRWTMWYDTPSTSDVKGRPSSSKWNSSLKQIFTFDTVEDFWWYVFCVYCASDCDR